jgi:hypothetical protein
MFAKKKLAYTSTLICLSPASFWLISLAYFSTLKIEAVNFFETPADLYRIAWYYIPESNNFHSHSREKLKSSVNYKCSKKAEDKYLYPKI